MAQDRYQQLEVGKGNIGITKKWEMSNDVFYKK